MTAVPRFKTAENLGSFLDKKNGYEFIVEKYSILTSRQRYSNNDGYFECNGIVSFPFNPTIINGKLTNKLTIFFIAIGNINWKVNYNGNDKSWNLELPGEDLVGWISILNNSNSKRLVINTIEEISEYFDVYIVVDKK